MNNQFLRTSGALLASLLIFGCASTREDAHSSHAQHASGDFHAVSDNCPTCSAETSVAPAAEVTYTTQVCPTCDHTESFDEYSENPTLGTGSVHVCEACETIVEPCASCAVE